MRITLPKGEFPHQCHKENPRKPRRALSEFNSPTEQDTTRTAGRVIWIPSQERQPVSSSLSLSESEQRRSLSWKSRRRIIELVVCGVFLLAAVGFAVLLAHWPFRYREVHPLLEHTFRSRVLVRRYHRTYFPHPGYVAEGITFYRLGDTQIPPLATLDNMTVVGSWMNLLFHPHELYEIRLGGLHVRIPPPGTKARALDFNGDIVAPSEQTIAIETIVADGTTLDFLATGNARPLRLQFPALQIHNVHQGQPLSFSARVIIPTPQGTVFANGSVGPFRTNNYGATPLSGRYSMQDADLSNVHGIAGHATAQGRYDGTFSGIEILGSVVMPDFRVASAHTVGLNATYRVRVNGMNGDVIIHGTEVRTGDNLITASGSIVGKPNSVNFTIGTKDSRVEDLLKIIEHDDPSVVGRVSFHAAVNLRPGRPEEFLQRLRLKGELSLRQISFVKPDTQHDMNAFAERVQKDPPGGSKDDPLPVTATASSQTTFNEGIADFQNIRVSLPGAEAYLHGSFNLLSTRIHFTGKADLQRDISRSTTGWKSALLKPLNPFFHHNDAGAIVSIAVTGTAAEPKITQDVLHSK